MSAKGRFKSRHSRGVAVRGVPVALRLIAHFSGLVAGNGCAGHDGPFTVLFGAVLLDFGVQV